MDVLSRPPDAAPHDADTVAAGLFEGDAAPAGVPAQAAELLASGEAQAKLGSVAVAHADGRRWLLAGLGPREELTPERVRVAAAAVLRRAREASARSLCWLLPEGGDDATAAALVEGTVLTDYRFDRFKSGAGAEDEQPRLERLVVACPEELEGAVGDAAVIAARVNRARDLQNRPGNDLTPTALGGYASALAQEIPELSVEVEGRDGLAARGMGAFSAVAQGSEQEPALITMRYEPPSAAGTPALAFVGKAVTFDSGGISLKPGAKMSEMKFDMSGGAAAIEATAAIAALGLPLRLLTVVGATENLPSGGAVKPGDIVTAANGRTIEINNTDAEGRLVLADCLCHAVAEGAARIVDLATLTGAVIVALGSTYAGLMSNDEELAAHVTAAGERSGEIVWRLPLHEEYDELIKGTYADLDNAPEARKAGTIVGGAFLANFVGETPWAHLDIAGTAWELGRPYVGKGASGFGVRLLVELARELAG
jgi:leucyl aminopeptidase